MESQEIKPKQEMPPASPPAQKPPEAAQPPQQPSKKPISKAVLIFACVGIIAIVATIAIILMRPQEEPGIPVPAQPTQVPEVPLTLDSPSDQTLVVQNEILVSGTTMPDATVAVYTEDDEIILEADSTGRFETTVTLAPGINSLNVKAFSPTGEEKSVSLSVVYDNEQS